MAEPIITSEKPSTKPLLDPPSRVVCHVCQKQFSQYTCPRCNSRYCSLHCYKSHNLRCTESFMRENVEGELGQLGPDDETKQKMLDILKRFHSEEEADAWWMIRLGSSCLGRAKFLIEGLLEFGLGSTLSEETIQKVLSGVQVSFDDLSAEEKKLFQKAVASGELSKMISLGIHGG
ncbi:zinc finger HIT domain-containing protein 2 [Prunus yedoensis var. nudiflora]|uniref:Zinc finger HIT domain-containing protein 2 n=1 Tax=Prunus yedoensis var. nudiflora TaxID=2094558 RepID=A0A314Z0B9_PRUYE|nr:zinc finger HIT domain-containing protein 2 [Prunus yedoensis var. nudiflora]